MIARIGEKLLSLLQMTRETAANTFNDCLVRKKYAYKHYLHMFRTSYYFFTKNYEKQNRIARQLLSPGIKSFIYGHEYWRTAR